jgi:hypothetical protein
MGVRLQQHTFHCGAAAAAAGLHTHCLQPHTLQHSSIRWAVYGSSSSAMTCMFGAAALAQHPLVSRLGISPPHPPAGPPPPPPGHVISSRLVASHSAADQGLFPPNIAIISYSPVCVLWRVWAAGVCGLKAHHCVRFSTPGKGDVSWCRCCCHQVWDLPNTAYLSSWLLLIITGGAVVCSAFFERRLWCRYL